MAFTLRELDRKKDRKAVEAIDTSFQTTTVFAQVTSARRIELVEQELPEAITKRYEIDEVFAPWASWEVGWVAEEDGAVRGFATVEYEAWNERLNLWFLYISPPWRRRGVGRALVERVEAYGKKVGASHVWLETSSHNVPGVRAYERIGFSLCGADHTYYGRYMPGETALFLSKPL